MKNPIVVRKYIFEDAVLKQKADEFINLLDRDFAEFAERGYDAAAKIEFENARDIVNNDPSDEGFKAKMLGHIAQKNAERRDLEKTMRSIFSMAANQFGVKSAAYRSFGCAEISRISDADFSRCYKPMVSAATEKLAVLAAEGLSQTKIDLLTTQGAAFANSIVNLAVAISERNIAAEKRVKNLNALYSLVAKYARTGQDIFYETSEAKYNDYVIYNKKT